MELEQNQSYYEDAIIEELAAKAMHIRNSRKRRAIFIIKVGLADKAWERKVSNQAAHTVQAYIDNFDKLTLDLYEYPSGEAGVRIGVDDRSLTNIDWMLIRTDRTWEIPVTPKHRAYIERMLDDMHESNRESDWLDEAIRKSELNDWAKLGLIYCKNQSSNFYGALLLELGRDAPFEIQTNV